MFMVESETILLLKMITSLRISSCMVVLSTRAMPVVFGLNMQTADTVIVFDSDGTTHKWTSMPHRIGMNKEVRVF